MTFLIVDDSKAIRFLMRRALEELGHVVVGEAATGLEACELYRKLKPEMVTLDLVMPGENGTVTLSRLKEIDPNARVIVVTSAATHETQKEVMKTGALAILHKPFTKNSLAEILNQRKVA